jgi:hypothetical protein
MRSSDFGQSLMSALPLTHAQRLPRIPHIDGDIPGLLRLKDMVSVPGFSGGGAYVKVPAIALNPKAARDAPGDVQL